MAACDIRGTGYAHLGEGDELHTVGSGLLDKFSDLIKICFFVARQILEPYRCGMEIPHSDPRIMVSESSRK